MKRGEWEEKFKNRQALDLESLRGHGESLDVILSVIEIYGKKLGRGFYCARHWRDMKM